MVEASNDFDSTDHQGGMFWPHVLPGQRAGRQHPRPRHVAGSRRRRTPLTTTYRARSGYTSWGTHNMFSAATTGGTTSESTPTVGGVIGAACSSYGKKAADAAA